VAVGYTPEGQYLTRSIEDLREGDYVLARDQHNATDNVELRRVAAVLVKTSDHVRVLRIQDADGNVETIRTTDEHPFYVTGPSGAGWVRAGELVAGQRLNEADNSNDAVILSSEREEHPAGITVYNLTVEGDHTYFVDDGQGATTSVWVHNNCAGKHHFVPRFLGSTVRKGSELLTKVGLYFHTHLHQKLREHLSQPKYLKTLADDTVVGMLHRSGYGQKQIHKHFSKRERIRALVEFYKSYTFGGRSFYKEFRAEMKETLKRGLFM
jgi:hypothetical protein